MNSIVENLARVREQIAQAAAKSERAVDEIELVAITKTHDAAKVREAVEAGQILFGESRVQEARVKIPELPSNLRWHFVGHLQKNKIRHALPLFELFHSVDSLSLAQEINRIAEEEGMHPRVLLEVNVAGEGSKFGFSAEKLRNQMEALLALPRLSIEGLMTIPPLAKEAEASRGYFVDLRELRDRLETEFQMKLPHLSMGMTNDFPVAVAVLAVPAVVREEHVAGHPHVDRNRGSPRKYKGWASFARRRATQSLVGQQVPGHSWANSQSVWKRHSLMPFRPLATTACSSRILLCFSVSSASISVLL